MVKNSGCDKQHILSVACIWVNNKYAVDTRVWIKFKGYHKLYWVTLQIHDIVQSCMSKQTRTTTEYSIH